MPLCLTFGGDKEQQRRGALVPKLLRPALSLYRTPSLAASIASIDPIGLARCRSLGEEKHEIGSCAIESRPIPAVPGWGAQWIFEEFRINRQADAQPGAGRHGRLAFRRRPVLSVKFKRRLS